MPFLILKNWPKDAIKLSHRDQNFIEAGGKIRSGSSIPEHTRISCRGKEHIVSAHERKSHYVNRHLRRKKESELIV